jgi:hypothetical protein
MKPHIFKTLAAVTACVVAAAALPAVAADQPSGSTLKNRDSRSGSEITQDRTAAQERRLDFGKPVRFIRNTFSRDDDQSGREAGMNRPEREESRAERRSQQPEDQRSGMSGRDRGDERNQRGLWNRGQDRNDREEVKKEDEKQGFFSRLLSWRPFNRDRDQ